MDNFALIDVAAVISKGGNGSNELAMHLNQNTMTN